VLALLHKTSALTSKETGQIELLFRLRLNWKDKLTCYVAEVNFHPILTFNSSLIVKEKIEVSLKKGLYIVCLQFLSRHTETNSKVFSCCWRRGFFEESMLCPVLWSLPWLFTPITGIVQQWWVVWSLARCWWCYFSLNVCEQESEAFC
jgi:hypothetical protein